MKWHRRQEDHLQGKETSASVSPTLLQVQLTHCRHNLRLQAELTLEVSCKVVDSAASVASDIGYFPNMIEHVAADEKQYRDEADRRPDIAVL
jgi:hypothetical protein